MIGVADSCYIIGCLAALVPGCVLSMLGKHTSGGIAGAFGMWALGAVIMLPVTAPMFILGRTIDILGQTKSLRDELQVAERKRSSENH